MSRGRSSTRFVGAIREQSLCHAAALEDAAEGPDVTVLENQYAPVGQLELDIDAGFQPSRVSHRLRDHDLPFGSDSMSHTTQYNFPPDAERPNFGRAREGANDYPTAGRSIVVAPSSSSLATPLRSASISTALATSLATSRLKTEGMM